MDDHKVVYGIIFLLFLLILAILIAEPGAFTGAVVGIGSDLVIQGEHLFASCSKAGSLGVDFAKNVIVSDYGCDLDLGKLLCLEASRDGVLPGDVTVEFGCTSIEQKAFVEACEFELGRLCS